jgi:hypothetical protein
MPNDPPYNDLADECGKMAAKTANLEHKKVFAGNGGGLGHGRQRTGPGTSEKKAGHEAETFA